MIAPHSNAEFVADMEKVLELYRKPYDSRFPVVCFDEMPRQLIGEFRPGEPMIPGYAERIDYEYVRNGTCNILMATEPLRGWRMAEVTENKTAKDWALFTEKIIEAYPEAEKIILVEDNLSTHKAASWYSAFPPEKAKRLMDRVEFVYTPKHGSWLNMIESFFSKLTKQMLRGIRVNSKEELRDRIYQYFDEINQEPVVYHWTYKLDEVDDVELSND